ncbi:unnamed protein product [Ascophyllum nodosum]
MVVDGIDKWTPPRKAGGITEEELLRQDIADFTISKKEDWVPIGCMPHPEEERVRLNVGGQIFETSKAVLRRDSSSLLGALCGGTGPLRADDGGTVYVDRDWWTFRHILKFLRDGILPRDTTSLTQLYREAGFWRCQRLKCAIEEQFHFYRTKFEVDASCVTRRKSTGKKVDRPHVKNFEGENKAAGKNDWWTGSEYNGRQYATPKCGEGVSSYARKTSNP